MAKEERMPQPGDLIAGKYRIETLLGRGGMGAVFAAKHIGTGRLFAVKWMEPSLAEEDSAKARFIREAKLAGSITHPGVVKIYDVGEHDGSLYMVMDLLKGESLGQRLKRGPIPFAEAAHIMLGVARGAAAAHKKGVVHRDLKPDNIFLCCSGLEGADVQPMILDFGVCKGVDACSLGMPALTRTGITLGTPLYMSPEQLEGSKDLDQRSDIYALGIILYQMVNGDVPYRADNFASLVVKIVSGNPAPLASMVAGLPQAFSDVVMRAFALRREDRYPDAESLAVALAPFANGERLGVASDSPPARKAPLTQSAESLTPFAKEVYAPRRTSIKRFLPAGAAMLTIGIGALVIWNFSSRTGSKEAAPILQPSAQPATENPLEPALTPAPNSVRTDGGVAAREGKDASLPMGVEAPRSRPAATGETATDREKPAPDPSAKPAVKPSRTRPSNYKIDEERILDPFTK
jgi:eukaryotic-like serine/threonine-protein kinase